MTMTESILSWYDRASATDIWSGIAWYGEAHLIARECGDPVKGAGLIAAFSPRTPWVRNLFLARIAFNDVRMFRGTLGDNIAKANAIIEGMHPLEALGKGLKTRSFFDNILNPLTSNEVTVDTHAIKIAGIDKDSVTPKQYGVIADAYREAAYSLGLAPLDLQAITWIAYRRINKIDWRDIRA